MGQSNLAIGPFNKDIEAIVPGQLFLSVKVDSSLKTVENFFVYFTVIVYPARNFEKKRQI
jgi:hypothetical protein